MSCHVMSCRASRRLMSCHVMSCHVMSRHVVSCHAVSSRVVSCRVVSCSEKRPQHFQLTHRSDSLTLTPRILTPLMLTQLTVISLIFTPLTLSRLISCASRCVVLHPRLPAFRLPTLRFPLEFQMWGYPVLLMCASELAKQQKVTKQ